MADPRKEFVLSTVANLCGFRTIDALPKHVTDDACLNRFLDDMSCTMLQAVGSPSSPDGLTFGNELSVAPLSDGLHECHFMKLRPEPLTDANVSSVVMVSSMVRSPLDSLYHAVHQVYAPTLLRDGAWSSRVDAKLQSLLAELETSLGSSLRGGSSSSSSSTATGPSKHSLHSFDGIVSPCDEFTHWEDVSHTAGPERDRGSEYCKIFDPIRPAFSRLSDAGSISLSGLLEVIDDTQDALDALWRAHESAVPGEPYPQERMAHLFASIASALARFVSTHLGGMDIWNGAFNDVRTGLRDGIRVCDKWQAVTNDLCGTYWSTLDSHPWAGTPHADLVIAQLSRRLEEIQRIRNTHEELVSLLSADEQAQLRVGESFKPFARVQPLHVNAYTQPAWEAAVAEHERSIQPVESHVARKLRAQIAGVGERPQQLLREFAKYRNLLQRPTIVRDLAGERDTLLAQLTALVESLDAEFESRASSMGGGGAGSATSPAGRNVSPVVANVVWAQAIRSKLAGSLKAASTMLRDLPSFSDFKSVVRDLAQKLDVYQKDMFKEWVETVTEALDDGELSLEMTGRVMEFDVAGNMIVNYSEKLVTLLRDTRQLSELGQRVPDRIKTAATDAEKYYRYGVMLKKVANFYNTMGSQIIATQKSMLLEPLLEFESTVQRPTGDHSGGSVTWSDPEQCAAYVQKLQVAADRLSADNRALRKLHQRLSDDVVALMNIDLLRQRDMWKARWISMRDMVTALKQKKNYPPEHMAKWLLHWDYQLYKAVEVGYRMGLESLNENLPEIKAELVFSQRQLQFRPPLEELRANYYREMKKFISVPNQFTGFGNAHVFAKMADRNAASLVQVYRKAEILFARLGKLRDKYTSWVVLGTVTDLDAYVEATVTTVAGWDANFKMLKVRRKESEKLPDFQKVDCVNVSLAPFKSSIEDHLQRLSDALVLSLRTSLMSRLKTVEGYVESAMVRLNDRPSSVEEIGKAKKEWKEIADSKPAMRAEVRACEDLKRLLLSVAGSNVELSDITMRLAKLPDNWENFEIAVEAFNEMIEEQRSALRVGMEEQVISVNKALMKTTQRWEALKPKELATWSAGEVDAVFTSLAEWEENLAELRDRAATLRDNCESFQLPEPKFEGLDALAADIQETQATWNLYKEYHQELSDISGQDWITFRTRIFDLQDFATKWLDKVKGRTKSPVCVRVYEEADGIRRAAPALKYARGDPFKEEHWSQVFKKLGMPKGVRLESLTVGHFLGVIDAVQANVQYLKELQSRAQGEVTIREALQELKAWGETAEFDLLDHVSAATGHTTSIIQHWKDLFTEIGDNQSLLQSLKESQYFKPFADQAEQFEVKVAALDDICQNLNAIQRRWVYLEPIFGRGALPAEQARFRRVDDEYTDVMGKITADPRVFSLADAHVFPGLGDTLRTMVDQLDRCQKALSDFLEQKRSAMPRFYFIGDDDLLEILGQAKNPTVIQAHLKKLFQGVHRVELSDDQRAITAICSVAGEVVPLASPVAINEEVETWLTSLAGEMQDTLARLLVECVQSGESDLRKYPSQVLCLAEQICFTRLVDQALQSGGGAGALHQIKARLQEQLGSYTAHDLSSEPLLQLKVKNLVLDLIHHMDVVDQLVDAGVSSQSAWEWQKQLRFYLNKSGKCVARMCDAECAYTYEYQGNAGKLVHTPLTDKCYLTLTQGMAMGYGGNPYGPAGTGKTESVKALGAALGRQVLVFNCDEGIDFHSMGRIFTGLVKCGAWGCFDEFNRLKEDQLSAVSQQIQVIQAAIKDHTPSIALLGKTIDVNFNAGIFVTMNPAGKGYGGRSKLPDNLKQLFRPVAMSKPDMALIAEVILYSEGFSGAKDLGQKMVSLFTLSKQLLSQQQHYDWGLRAMKTCLNTGGKLVQELKQSGSDLTAEVERETLIKAIRVNTLSKLTFDDSKRFLGLLGDVFPGVKSEDISVAALEDAIKEVMTNKPFNLQHDETQVSKMMQLKESLDQRMGCVIVGPSGCGKSTLWRVLQAALEKIGQKVVTYVMNPKSMPRTRLLGEMDPDTREWTDGVLTAAARAVVKEPLETRSWIICDGDVDPEWIESLNSVLDDNHLLTMPNGERISFGSNINFLFETHDLRFASPATISRMGMIFLSDEDVDVKRVVQCWVDRQPEDDRMRISGWMEDMFYRALQFVLDARGFVVDTTMVGTVLNALSHLTGTKTKPGFVVGLIRGLGSNLSTKKRTAFAKELFSWAGERPPDLGAPLDCTVNPDTQRLESFVAPNYDGMLDRSDLEKMRIIDTVSVQRTSAMIQPWVDNMEPFILVGPEGCGKSMLVQHLCRSRRGTSITSLHCNAQTTAEHVIQRIRQACSLYSSNAGRVYRPREGDRLVLFLKDVNLPRPDMYATCALIAFLQQLVTFNGFYDENLEFLGIERVHIVCTMNPATTVGRHHLSTRFTAIVRIAYMDYPDSSELSAVYGAYLQAALQPGPHCRVMDDRFRSPAGLSKLAATMIDLFEQVKSRFSVDDHRHYLFTPRDLTSWVTGLLRYDVATEPLLDIVAHEAQRTFRDRIVDADGEVKFDSMLAGLLQRQWRHSLNLDDIVYTALGIGGGSKGRSSDAAGAGGDGGEETKHDGGGGDGDGGGAAGSLNGSPLERMSADDLHTIVSKGIEQFEREEKELHMLLFPEIMDHLVRVDRVLSKESGSLLCVGRSGVGRRTATTLVAHMHGMQMFSPNITRDYTLRSFFSDLKAVLAVAGVQGEEVVLLVEDHHLTDEAILETINSLLASGEVPGLYTHEELEPLLGPLKELMQETGFSFRTPYEFFVARIVSNLHLVVSFDQTDPRFLVRCESNPALFTKTTVLWMGEWRRKSMRQVPQMLVPRMLDLARDSGEVVEAMLAIHDSAKARGATPLDYVTFLQQYETLYDSKVGGIESKVKNLQSGLSKLNEAEATVDELTTSATAQRAELKTKQTAADEAMEAITEALAVASDRRKEVEILQGELETIERDSLARKGEVEEELSTVQPLLDQAAAAVGGIKQEQLAEVRSMKAPPAPVHDVLSAVLTLLGVGDTSWQNMKKFLGNRRVKEQILQFDPRRVTHGIRKAVQKILKAKAHSFEKEVITRASVAASPLALWVQASLKFSVVTEKIEPLERELHRATESLNSCQARLDENTHKLAELDARVSSLKTDFAQRTAEAERLRAALQSTEDTLGRAQQLLGQLSGEKTRWDRTVTDLRTQVAALPMQMLLAAGFVTYLAKSPEDIRAAAVDTWLEICHLEAFNVLTLLSSESEMLTWKAAGLPADTLSMQNAVVIENATARTPFIIDPASAATQWLQCHLAKDKASALEVVLGSDPRMQTQVELAVRFGKTLLILEVDGVDPMLFPLVRRDLQNQGPRLVVQIGEKMVDFDPKTRVFFATRNPRPDIPPSCASLITEVNFTVTRSGLEGQLLGVTLQHEQPALQEQKSAQLKLEEELKVQISDLEAELIEALASSTGNILDNQALVDSLTKTKIKAADIQESLAKSAEATAELELQSQTYRPFSRAGSALFFLIQDLKNRDHMYQFALKSFVGLFQETLETKTSGGGGGGGSGVENRIAGLVASLERRVLFYVGRSLFKADRLMYAMHLVHTMHPELFQDNEWKFFVGDLVPDLGSTMPRDFPSWAAQDRLSMYKLFSQAFPALVRNCNFSDEVPWSRWSRAASPEVDFPPGVTRSLSAFQRLMVVLTLRPDRLVSAMLAFVTEVLRVDSITPAPTSLSDLVGKEASAVKPILMITTSGADPSTELGEFATKAVGRSSYSELAMGGGQQGEAVRLLKSAASDGKWLCLKNLHLVVAWLPQLEKEINGLVSPHPDFRLFLTTESHAMWPAVLLQHSVKVTFEAPPGLKKNLERTYSGGGAFSPESLSGGSTVRAQLLFLLAWLHGVVQERLNYCPVGWSKGYEFSAGDLRAGVALVDKQAASMKDATDLRSLPWKFLHGLLMFSVYGGRIDVPSDTLVLQAWLAELFNVDVLSGRGVTLFNDIEVPRSNVHGDYMALVGRLSDTDPPGLFKLPANISRSVERLLGQAVVQSLKALLVSTAAGTSFDRERWREMLGPVLEVWAKLTSADAITDPTSAQAQAREVASQPPVVQFVLLEHKMAAELVARLDKDLRALKKVVFGTGLLTPAIQKTATALLAETVPLAWERMYEGSETDPKAWLRTVVAKRTALSEWSDKALGGRLLNDPLSLADLFRPQTFLNALRQQTARAASTSIDALKLVSSFDAARLSSAAVPIQLSGLMIQGAHFDGGQLVAVDSSASEVAPLPPVSLAYVDASTPAPHDEGSVYACPVYLSLLRETNLMSIQVPSREPSATWVLAGVAASLTA